MFAGVLRAEHFKIVRNSVIDMVSIEAIASRSRSLLEA